MVATLYWQLDTMIPKIDFVVSDRRFDLGLKYPKTLAVIPPENEQDRTDLSKILGFFQSKKKDISETFSAGCRIVCS
jgi:hypothetical protein